LKKSKLIKLPFWNFLLKIFSYPSLNMLRRITPHENCEEPTMRAPVGYLGDGRLGVKRVGDGRIGQKSGRLGAKKFLGATKMGEIVNYVWEQGDRAK
jgi:hypothetical protein